MKNGLAKKKKKKKNWVVTTAQKISYRSDQLLEWKDTYWKKRTGGWYASSATERKDHVESISFVEGEQPSFYAENIPFSSSTIFSSSPTHKLVSCHASPRFKISDFGAFRQDLYNHAKMLHLGQSHNVVIYMCADIKHDREDVSSIFPITHFSPPDLILHAWHIRARFEQPCAQRML